MRKAPLVLAVIPLILFASAAEAKNRDKAWEFGAFLVHLDGDRDAGVDNEIGGELRVGYNFTAKVEAELNVLLASGETAGRDASYTRAVAVITGNFLTDRETPWIPFISAGLGIVTETVDATEDSMGNEILEAFDAGTILTLGVGTRYFWNDNWGARFEGRYNHHDAFETNQDEYVLSAGITWIVGGAQ
jgi:outer membrane protein W